MTAQEQVFEVRIVDVARMPEHTQAEIARQVAAKQPGFDYQGFVKVIYVTASPPKIKSVEPIEGTPIEYYQERMEGVDFAVF